ncbi:hypothetical protein FM131_02260 [Weissella confusa]|nr:hypothetical protein FM131_02260 [Weissella confusa]
MAVGQLERPYTLGVAGAGATVAPNTSACMADLSNFASMSE